MKSFRIIVAVALALFVLLGLGAMSVAAQGPSGVAFLDNQPHSIAANSSQLYQFDYAVDTTTNTRPVTTITMPNGTNSGLGFQVWTADTVGDMTDNHPIGQGTAQSVNCDTGAPEGGTACQSADLTWSGSFGTGGTYFVLVTNNTNAQANYQLNIQGSGVSLGQQTAAAPSAPAAAPAVAANTDDPGKATAIDNAQHAVPANSAVWYSFNYAVDTTNNTRPVVTITLPNGTNSGVTFEVWTPESMQGNWWDNKPVGRGTPQPVDCDTGQVSGTGTCQSPDLTWSGSFGTSGTYLVRVVNSNNAPANATLTIK